MADKILNQPQVTERTGASRTTLWRLERAGEFPRRRQIVGHRVGWLESEVTEWLRTRPVVVIGSDGDDA